MAKQFLIMVFTLLAHAAPLWAQADAAAPPAAETAPPGNTWMPAVVAVILAGLIVAVSIKNAKRTHRD